MAEFHPVADLQSGNGDDLRGGFERADARLHGGDNAVEVIVEESDAYGEEEGLDIKSARTRQNVGDLLGTRLGQVGSGSGRSSRPVALFLGGHGTTVLSRWTRGTQGLPNAGLG